MAAPIFMTMLPVRGATRRKLGPARLPSSDARDASRAQTQGSNSNRKLETQDSCCERDSADDGSRLEHGSADEGSRCEHGSADERRGSSCQHVSADKGRGSPCERDTADEGRGSCSNPHSANEALREQLEPSGFHKLGGVPTSVLEALRIRSVSEDSSDDECDCTRAAPKQGWAPRPKRREIGNLRVGSGG